MYGVSALFLVASLLDAWAYSADPRLMDQLPESVFGYYDGSVEVLVRDRVTGAGAMAAALAAIRLRGVAWPLGAVGLLAMAVLLLLSGRSAA